MNLKEKEIEVTLKMKIKSYMENTDDNDENTLVYLIEEDLKDLGYEIDYVEVIKEKNK